MNTLLELGRIVVLLHAGWDHDLSISIAPHIAIFDNLIHGLTFKISLIKKIRDRGWGYIADTGPSFDGKREIVIGFLIDLEPVGDV